MNAVEREWMAQPLCNNDIDFRGMNRAPVDTPFTQREPHEAQSLQAIDQIGEGNPGIDKGAENHVSADTRVTIKMEMPAHLRSFHRVVQNRAILPKAARNGNRESARFMTVRRDIA